MKRLRLRIIINCIIVVPNITFRIYKFKYFSGCSSCIQRTPTIYRSATIQTQVKRCYILLQLFYILKLTFNFYVLSTT